jgi:hypothetical protein
MESGMTVEEQKQTENYGKNQEAIYFWGRE